MKKNFIRIITLILAIAISTGAFVTAFAADIAAEDITAAPEINEEAPEAELIEAKIIKIPLKNKVVIGHHPDMAAEPDGIVVELKYSDGTVITDKVVVSDEKVYPYAETYSVNGEILYYPTYVTVVRYGMQEIGYYLNDYKVKISYKCLFLPTISDILHYADVYWKVQISSKFGGA